MWGIIKSLFVLLLYAAGGYAVFFLVAHFTLVQSTLLTILAASVISAYRWLYQLATTRTPRIEPFWVRVSPNWYAICQDYGLYDVNRWEELLDECAKQTPEYSVFRHGINFTMLSPTLFYSNDQHYFFGEIDVRCSIDELKPATPDRFLGTFTPQFYVKRALGGKNKKVAVIEFGLITQESLKKSFHPADHADHVPIASLPEIVFYFYNNPDMDNYKLADKIHAETKERLADFAWTTTEQDPEYSSLHPPEELKHKYLTITYKGIG